MSLSDISAEFEFANVDLGNCSHYPASGQVHTLSSSSEKNHFQVTRQWEVGMSSLWDLCQSV